MSHPLFSHQILENGHAQFKTNFVFSLSYSIMSYEVAYNMIIRSLTSVKRFLQQLPNSCNLKYSLTVTSTCNTIDCLDVTTCILGAWGSDIKEI